MRKLSCLILITAVLFTIACSHNQLQKRIDKKALHNELSSWENFRIDGIVTIENNGLSLIKNITVTRDSSQLKIIIYDSGLFGAIAKPFARLVIGDSLELEIPMIDDPAEITYFADTVSKEYRTFTTQLNKDHIVQNTELIDNDIKYNNKDIEIIFDHQMQILEIAKQKPDTKLVINRDKEGLPQEMLLYHQKRLAMLVEIDKFINR